MALSLAHGMPVRKVRTKAMSGRYDLSKYRESHQAAARTHIDDCERLDSRIAELREKSHHSRKDREGYQNQFTEDDKEELKKLLEERRKVFDVLRSMRGVRRKIDRPAEAAQSHAEALQSQFGTICKEAKELLDNIEEQETELVSILQLDAALELDAELGKTFRKRPRKRGLSSSCPRSCRIS